jgi:4-amino-4-deoxy-L-arabinose transferase-like glycosyltransferase
VRVDHLRDARHERDAASADGAPVDATTRARRRPLGRSRSREEKLFAAGVVLVLAVAAFLRFWTPSALWLDEALNVDISKLPVGQIPAALRHDGAPPLYYVLLHYWMKVFGSGDLAARALAGVTGLANLPLAYLAGERTGSRGWRPAAEISQADRARGKTTGWTLTLLLASSPFAVYYDTEARMYALVILLTTTGLLALVSLLRRPTPWNWLALALSASLLLYTHYWALYLLFVTGCGLVWRAFRGPYRRQCRLAVGALVLAGLSFIPWLPVFVFQLRHTGTPWATPADLTALVFTVTQFAGGNSDAGRGLALLFFFLAVLALFGAPIGASRVELELRTRRGVRAMMAVIGATLLVAVVAGKLSQSGFADRYTAVVVLPCLLVVAYGATTIASVRIRRGVTAAAVLLGLGAAIPNAFISRTQAGQVATAILAKAQPGDVVAYCPDQLGPAVSRVLDNRFTEVTYPRRTGPDFVNWVDYAKVNEAARPAVFARYVTTLAGSHTIWYVFTPGYLTFGMSCESIASDLASLHSPSTVVVAQAPSDTPFEIFEGESLYRYGRR